MIKPHHLYAHLINSIPAMTYKRLKTIYNYFSSFERAWMEIKTDSLISARLKPEIAELISQQKNLINQRDELLKLERLNLKIITLNDPDYPPLLKEIYDPPFLLYVRGNLTALAGKKLAIVGTRRSSLYGRQVTEKLVKDLAKDFTIISGLAEGIDTFAHQATLSAEGKTVAVCGFGLAHIFPASNKNLAKKIEAAGCVISEFRPEQRPEPWCFPLRNRIISGLSLGTIVIEAPAKSGALITAQSALDQGREVFAVPGDITRPASNGVNKLIRDGQAMAILGVEDILEKFDIRRDTPWRVSTKAINLSESEQKIFDLLAGEMTPIDNLIRQSSLPAGTVMSVLSLLEIKGVVKNCGGTRWRVNNQ